MKSKLSKIALRTSLLYAVLAGAWIFFSDELLTWLAPNMPALAHFGTVKGWVFVLVTGLLVYLTFQRQFSRWEKEVNIRRKAEANLAALAEVGARLSATRTEREAAEIIAEIADGLFGWEACVLNLYSRQDDLIMQLLVQDTIEGRRVECQFEEKFSPPTPLMREVIGSGGKLILKEKLEPCPGTTPFGDKSRPSASIMLAPIRHDAKVTGLIAIHSYEFNAYTREDLAVLQSLADHCGGALERFRAENALRESERRFQTMGEIIGEVFWLASADFQSVLYVSPAFERIWGMSRAELYTHPTAGLRAIHPEDRPRVIHALKELTRGTAYNIEFRIRQPDGTLRWINDRGYPQHDAPGKVVLTSGVATDITESKKAGEQLRKLSRAVEQSPALIVITDVSGKIEYANPRFSQVTGYDLDEVRGKTPRILKSGKMDPAVYEQLWKTILSGRNWSGELQNLKKNGELFWSMASVSPIVDESGRITHFLSVAEDVTERKSLEAQFRQSQKMEAIGQLAGGVAHDFNNLLTVIQGHCSMLLADPAAKGVQESISEIDKAADRAANLTRQLLAFSRRQTMHPRDLDLNELLANTIKMLQRLLGEHIRTEFRFAPESLILHADAGMLDQILLNLAVNSRDAMPRGGRLIIETAAADFDASSAAANPQARPGNFVCLTVSDNGCGIPKHILPRIFEPFFTTKDIGKGTGLGLATVYGIVQQHRGWISVYSEVDQGTTFRIYLPRSRQNNNIKSSQTVGASAHRGNETILLVEDDPALRKLMRNILHRLGYQILETSTARGALEVWKDKRDQIHLVITDLVMPDGISGTELGKRLLEENPRLPILYTSGYSPEIIEQGTRFKEGFNFLSKPFHPHKLAELVRQTLDEH